MTFRKLYLLAIVLYFAISSGAFAANRLPGVAPKMETPEFWTEKLPNPSQPLLSSEEIERMNEQNLKREDLFLWRVAELKEEWSREELLVMLREDWAGFQSGGSGNFLGEPFWNQLKKNLNEEALKENNPLRLALVVKRSDIRFFPTAEACTDIAHDDKFDRFQHSTVPPGSLVGVHHFSKDGLWAYVQTRFVRGWMLASNLATSDDRNEALGYEQASHRLTITGSSVHVFDDPSFRQPLFSAQMGTSFHFLGLHQYHVIKIPVREKTGKLSFRKGYIPADADVHRGFLPYTQKNLAIQAFKMLHQPYAWGEKSGGLDCSRFIMDLFASFGIIMPRNSMYQAKVGIPFSRIEGKTAKQKAQILDKAIPLATTIRFPGHIMLYLGKHEGKPYVIHSIWGIRKKERSGPIYEKIGKVVVSDLNLGQPDRTLLHRSTDIQVIGSTSWMQNSP